jgi:hypothetical protein
MFMLFPTIHSFFALKSNTSKGNAPVDRTRSAHPKHYLAFVDLEELLRWARREADASGSRARPVYPRLH